MRIIFNRTAGLLSEESRSRLRRIFLQDAEATMRTLQSIFPRQLLKGKCDHIQVVKTDGSIILDILQDGRRETNWVESAVNLRVTLK